MDFIVIANIVAGLIADVVKAYQEIKAEKITKETVVDLVVKSADFVALISGKQPEYVSLAYEIVDSLASVAVKVYNATGIWSRRIHLDIPEGGVDVR